MKTALHFLLLAVLLGLLSIEVNASVSAWSVPKDNNQQAAGWIPIVNKGKRREASHEHMEDKYGEDHLVRKLHTDEIDRDLEFLGRRQLKTKSSGSATLGIASAGKGSGSKGAKSSKKKSKSSKKSSKKSNIFDNGKGKGKGGPSAPTPTPPQPTPTNPTAPNTPTNPLPSPTPPPQGPSAPSTPTAPTAPATPTEAPATPPSQKEPPSTPTDGSPTLAPALPRCTFGGDGVFGSQIGIVTEIRFAYQTTVIPSVTVAELNLNILPTVDEALGERALERLFDQCSATAPSVIVSPTQPQPSRAGLHSNARNGGRKKGQPNRRHLRSLRATELKGFSTRPRDTVVEEVECANVEPIFPCFVIQGRVQSYTENPLDDETLEDVLNALEAGVEAGGLQNVDNRIISISWRDLDTDPLPGSDDDTDDDPSTDDNTPTPAPTGGNGPVLRNVDSGSDLENWAISLIAVSGAFVCCMSYLCLRTPARKPVYDDDDDDDGESSGSSSDEDEDAVGDDKQQDRVGSAAPGAAYRPPQTDDGPADPPRPPQQGNDDPYVVGAAPVERDEFQDEPTYGHGTSTEGSPIEEESEESESEEEESESEEESEDEESQEDDYGHRPSHDGMDAEEEGHMSYDEDDRGHEERGVSSYSEPPDNHRDPNEDDEDEVSPFGEGSKNEERWDERIFVANTDPPMESTSEEDEFTSEYSEEEEAEEEYEIEYVEDEEGLEEVEEEEEDDSFSEEDFEDEDQGIVEDEPGKTPILPWLADGQ